MEVRCEKCQARYRVDEGRIGPKGLTMRCGKCQNTFKVMRPSEGAAAAVAAKALEPSPGFVERDSSPADTGHRRPLAGDVETDRPSVPREETASLDGVTAAPLDLAPGPPSVQSRPSASQSPAAGPIDPAVRPPETALADRPGSRGLTMAVVAAVLFLLLAMILFVTYKKLTTSPPGATATSSDRAQGKQ
jgi:predicted Zn finger-like uncharacterized protein